MKSSPRLDGVALLAFVGFVLAMARLLAGCVRPEDAATKAAHVVVVGSYERRLDVCVEEGKAARSVAVFDACEREATRALCASHPELRAKAICEGVSDAGR